MTNCEMMEIAMRQSAEDMGCHVEDFKADKNVVVPINLGKKARKYLKEPITCNLVSYGNNIMAASIPETMDLVSAYVDKFLFIYSILYKPCIFKAYRLLNVQTLCIFPCFCPYEPKQGKFLFSADYLIQQSCGSTLRFPCSVSVNVHCGTDISVSEKFLHIFRCCTV